MEGFEAIKELSPDILRLRVKEGFIVVAGERLHVEYFGDGEIMIKGRIHSIQLK